MGENRLLSVHSIFSLLEKDRMSTISDLICYLFSSVGRQAVHYYTILLCFFHKALIYLVFL